MDILPSGSDHLNPLVTLSLGKGALLLTGEGEGLKQMLAMNNVGTVLSN
jgi:hypothetical protein